MSSLKSFLRFCEEEDKEDLLRWKNDEMTRRNSFNQSGVKKEDHTNWFNKSLKNPNRNIFILINEDLDKIGQIRFDREDKSAEIDITISSDFRGKGYGIITLKKGCQMYLNNFDVDYLVGKVKKDNISSIKIFEKTGFKKYKEYDDYIEFRLER